MSLYRRYIRNRELTLTLRDAHRRIFPFEWGLEWIQDGRPALHPLSSLKKFAAHSLQTSEDFFRPPSLGPYRRQDNLLTFATPAPTPYAENNTVYCRLFPARSSRRAVIVTPQWNADARSHVLLCRFLQKLGITAARLTLPYHEQRLPAGMKRADYMVSPNVGRTLHATRQAVLEVRQLADWLRRQGYVRIGVLGTSIGSCVCYLAFVHDAQICTGVFNHVSAFFADVVWTGLSTRYVRWGLEGNISLQELRECWAPISPWYFIARLQEHPRPHLLITAGYDLSFIPELSEKVFEQYRMHRIPVDSVALPCGHYTTATFPFKYLDAFHICRYLVRQL